MSGLPASGSSWLTAQFVSLKPVTRSSETVATHRKIPLPAGECVRPLRLLLTLGQQAHSGRKASLGEPVLWVCSRLRAPLPCLQQAHRNYRSDPQSCLWIRSHGNLSGIQTGAHYIHNFPTDFPNRKMPNRKLICKYQNRKPHILGNTCKLTKKNRTK